VLLLIDFCGQLLSLRLLLDIPRAESFDGSVDYDYSRGRTREKLQSVSTIDDHKRRESNVL
jgi:hypothetical protein